MRAEAAATVVALSPEGVCEMVPGLTVSILQRQRSYRRNGGADPLRAGPRFSGGGHGSPVVHLVEDVAEWLRASRV